jgi:hypothetical protein
MKVILAVLAVLGAACAGCAAPQAQTAFDAAAPSTAGGIPAPTFVRSRAPLTGSRLPPLDDDDSGSGAVSGMTGDEYRHQNDSKMMPRVDQK